MNEKDDSAIEQADGEEVRVRWLPSHALWIEPIGALSLARPIAVGFSRIEALLCSLLGGECLKRPGKGAAWISGPWHFFVCLVVQDEQARAPYLVALCIKPT